MSSHKYPLSSALQAVHRLLGRFGEQGLVIGGIAASMLGIPRFTKDIDAILLLSTEELPRLMKEAACEGLLPRIPDAETFARRNRVLLLHHQESSIDVDLSLGILPFEREAVERGIIRDAGDVSIRVPTAEDLVIFKAVAHRPKDLIDVQAIVDANPTLDRERIRSWVRQFAEVLEAPELWTDIAPWIDTDAQ